MKFVILYENKEEIRRNIEQIIPALIEKNAPFTTRRFKVNELFSSMPFWPTEREICKLSSKTQCEEVEWANSQLNSIRQLICDAVIITPNNQTNQLGQFTYEI